MNKSTGDGEAEFVVSDALKRQVREALFGAPSLRPTIDIEATDEPFKAQADAAKELLSATDDKQNKQEEAVRTLEARKQSEIERIKAVRAIVTDPDVLKELDELIDKIESAKSIDGLNRVLASVSTTISAALSKADDKSPDLDPLHKDLYANDAVYRKRVDEITEKSKVLQDDSKQRRETSDEIAKKHGIETKYDKEMADLLKEYEGLSELDKKSQKARELELKILLKEREQNDARIKQLEAKGLHAEADVLRKNTPPIEDAIEKATKYYQDQQRAYYEAYKLKLEKTGIDSKEITKRLEELSKTQEDSFKRLTKDKARAATALMLDGETVEEDTKRLSASENQVSSFIAEPKTKEQKLAEEIKQDISSKKMMVSDASLAQELDVPAARVSGKNESSSKELF